MADELSQLSSVMLECTLYAIILHFVLLLMKLACNPWGLAVYVIIKWHIVLTCIHIFTPTPITIDAVPTLPELFDFPGCTRKINIVQEIGIEWLTFGTLLLDDTMGTIVPEVKESCQGNIYNTNAEILGRWIRKADVSDCSWHNLIVTLRKSHRETLAQDIADRVGDDS